MIFPVLAEKIQRQDGTGLTVEEEITLHLSSLLPLFQQTYFLRRIIQSATYQISAFPSLVMSHDTLQQSFFLHFITLMQVFLFFKFAINKTVCVHAYVRAWTRVCVCKWVMLLAN